MHAPSLVVFSHLRWGFVYQRPQHLLSRLAGRWRVVFIEEPVRTEGPARLEIREVAPDLTVVVPHTPVAAFGFHDEQISVLEPLLTEYFQHRTGPAVAWLYTPMALPLVKTVGPDCTVFDCMDELSLFKDAPRQLRQRESALMKQAAVVFTGGPSLYQVRRDAHPNIHCVPSSVDAPHFAPRNLQADSVASRDVAALQGQIATPRLGFFGVIDERLDIGLVGAMADAHPEWQIVMVGPVVKIDPAGLPQRPNIHWLGMQSYERLPYFVAGWDVCLMPFAMNDATRLISPTKTLEYMAAEKPVVTTPVKDVVLLYGQAVRIADGGADFIAACEEVLGESAEAQAARAAEMKATVAQHSWDRSADTIHRLIDAALQDRLATTPESPQQTRVVSAAGARF
jgi:glycosyltransferase involved in cell wall biosynthesis